MARLLENVGVAALEEILASGRPAAPLAHLTDPAAIRRARRLARVNGIWKSLDSDLKPDAPIEVLKRSVYSFYKRTGNRRPADAFLHRRRVEIAQAAMALWLDHPRASLDRLQDLIWALCDDFTWVGTSHGHSVVDLFATDTGAMLCEVLAAIASQLEPQLVARVHAELEARILNLRDHPSNGWRTCHHNWNHVCNGNIVAIALHCWHDTPAKLAPLVHRCVTDMQLALDGFSDDGGCLEGPGYWTYGFSRFLRCADALHAFTGGRIDLMTADPKIERICRFPLAAHMRDDRHAPFADTSPGYIPAEVALSINRHFKIPELFALCRTHSNRTLTLGNWNELTLYRGEKAPRLAPGDSLLPELGLARIRSAPGKRQLTVVAAAGNNGVNHNHNDIGTFVADRNGVEFLTDPGGPIYNSKTFSSRRYEILFCNSLGHSVPLINGQQQGFGQEFSGTIDAAGLGRAGDKSVHIDMTRAYPAGTVESLQRTLAVDYAKHALTITDVYRFAGEPKSLIETFITYEPARLAARGKAVRIGKGGKTAVLAAAQPGRFKIVAETEASKEGRTGQVVKRILFTPAKLAGEMTLQFTLE